jgi:hypothetical protein
VEVDEAAGMDLRDAVVMAIEGGPDVGPCKRMYDKAVLCSHSIGVDEATCNEIAQFHSNLPPVTTFTKQEAKDLGILESDDKAEKVVFKSREDQVLNEMFSHLGVSMEQANYIISTLVKVFSNVCKAA